MPLSARATDLSSTVGLDPRTLGLIAALAVIWLGLDAASGGLFLTARNLYNLSVQSSVVGVMASGMVLVITARQIDLSVGSVLGVTGMAIAMLQAEWLPAATPHTAVLSVGLGLVAGAAIGAWQGWWVAYREVPAFVVTLGGLLVFRGLAYLLADGRTIAPLADGFGALGGGLEGSIGETASWLLASVVGLGVAGSTVRERRARRRHDFTPRPAWAELLRIAGVATLAFGFVAIANAHTRPGSQVGRGVPVPVLVWMASALGVALLFRGTRFGRHVLALGGSPRASLRAGIDTRRVTLAVFVWMGVLSALAGAIATARLEAGTTSLGTLAELSVIAAAVIGGTSLAGGRGSVAGAALGAVLMQSLENGMVLLGASSAVRQVAIGGVLIVAVWIDIAARRRSS